MESKEKDSPSYFLKTKFAAFAGPVIIFGLSFILRSICLDNITEYLSSDHVQQVLYAINVFENRSWFSLVLSRNVLAGLFSFPYGMGTLVFLYLWMVFLSILHITIDVPTVSILGALTGSLCVLGIYFLVKEVAGQKLAFWCALIVSIEPYLIAQSRDLGRYHIILALTLAIWTLYFFARYFKNKDKKNAWLASVFFTFYFGSSNMFILFILCILLIAFIFIHEKGKNIKDSIGEISALIFKKEILILPCILFAIYFLGFIYSYVQGLSMDASFLGKPLVKSKKWGFYFDYLSLCYIINCGYILYTLYFFGFLCGFYKFIKWQKESMLLFVALIYAIPFVFFTPPYTTVIRVYIMESEIFFAILGILFIFWFYGLLNIKRIYKNIYLFLALGVIYLSTFMLTLGFVFNSPVYSKFSLGTEREGCGIMIYGPNGAKSLGYYVRQNIPEGMKIFSDLEPILSQFYFGRNKVYCQYDVGFLENYIYLKEIKDKMDYIAISASDEERYLPLLKRGKLFYKIVEINYHGRPLRYLYSSKNLPGIIINKQEADKLFDLKYGKIDKLVPDRLDLPSENRPE